jgi:hypothetical protein
MRINIVKERALKNQFPRWMGLFVQNMGENDFLRRNINNYALTEDILSTL